MKKKKKGNRGNLGGSGGLWEEIDLIDDHNHLIRGNLPNH